MNPNEYDDAAYMAGHEALFLAVADLWMAGASEDDIQNIFRRAMEQRPSE